MTEREIFDAALQFPDDESRMAYLRQACGSDSTLREHLEGLVRAQQMVGSFLESCVPGLVATLDMPPEVPIAASPGTVIGPYKLLQQIGEGGMGVVYMAEQAAPVRRKVALKIIKPGKDTREVIARFEAERQALALMDHPNIARVFDGGATDAGRPYFVMELVRGVPITDYCDQNNLPVHERLELFVSVCHAVQHAHQKGIIHRDIKPTNVLVTLHDGRPVPKVIDFGVAKAIGQQLTDKTLFTQFAQMVGTPLYMSPEQAELTGLDIDTRGDIYSLGVLLYELLTGTTPFERGRMKEAALDEIRRMIREEDPPSPSTRLSSTAGETQTAVAAHRRVDPRGLSRLVRGDLDWIVMKALEKDRNRRYETANGFAADVIRFLSDEPVQACPPSSAYRFRKFARRNRGALSTAAVVLITLVLGTVVSTWQAIRATHAEELAETRLQAETNAKDDAVTAQAAAETARQEEARQRILAETARNEEASQRKVADHAKDDATRRLYRSQVDQARANRMSRRVGQRTKTLEVLAEAVRMAEKLSLPANDFLELRSEAIASLVLPDVRFFGETHAWPIGSRGFDLTAALDRYARIDRDGMVSIHRSADDSEICKFRGAEPGEAWPLFSSDGRFLAVWDSSHAGVKVWKVDGPEPILLLEERSEYLDFSPDSRRLVWGNADDSIIVFDLDSARRLCQYQIGHHIGHIAFHPAGLLLAVAVPSGVKILNVETGAVTGDLPHPGGVERVAWHPDGKTLAAFGCDRIFKIWDVASRQPTVQLKDKNYGGLVFAFSHDGNLLASTGWDKKLRVWDPRTGELVFQSPMPIMRLLCSQDDRLLAAHGSEAVREIRLAEIVPACGYRTLVRDPLLGRGEYYQSSTSPDDRLLAVGTLEGVALWDLGSGRGLEFLSGGGLTFGVLFESSGALLTSGPGGVVRWPTEINTPVPGEVRFGVPQPLPLQGKSSLIAASRDGRVVAKSMGSGGMVWHRGFDKPPLALTPHDDVGAIAVSPDGSRVATGSHSLAGVKVWNALSGESVREFPTIQPSVQVAFSADGRWLAATDGRLWETDSWKEVRRFEPCSGFAFSPDSKILAMESGTGVVHLVNPESGHEYARLEDPHQDRATNLCFSQGGMQLVATRTDSSTVHVWDLRAIRQEIKKMGLDWDLPPYPSANEASEAEPVTSVVVEGMDRPVWRTRGELLTTIGETAKRDQGKLAEAITAFNKALELEPNDLAAWKNRAGCFIRLGLLPEAAADDARAFQLQEPPDSLGFLHHALLRRCVEDGPGYTNACRRMLARFVDSANPDDWHNVALVLAYAPEPVVEPSRIVTFAERAVADNKTVWRAGYLGLAYFRAKQFERAVAALEESLTIDSNWNPAAVYSVIAMVQHRLKDMEKASTALDKARNAREERMQDMLARDIGFWPAPWWDVVHGELMYREAFALIHGSPAPDDARLLVLRGRALNVIGRVDEALAAFSKAIELNADLWEARSGRALIYFSRQQWDEAVADLSRAIDLAPQVHTHWWHRGNAYLNLAQWEQAAADFWKLIDQHPEGSEVWYLHGVALAQLNQPEKALADLRQAITRGFTNVELMKRDPRLDPLRTREDFAEVLRELEQKVKSEVK